MPGVLCPVVIGRAAETATLRAALASAAKGDGGLVFVTGEAGIGKSRLARELAAEARRSGIGAVAGRAVASGQPTPYRPLTEALSQALRDRPLPDDADLRPWLPALAAILPLGVKRVDGHGSESAVVRGEAVLQLLRRLAEPAGLLVILEDLHWADPDTLGVVEYLGDNLNGSRLLCLGTTRDEPRNPAAELVDRLASRRAAVAISLRRLARGQVEAMVEACLPGAPPAVFERVAAAAEGVPFLVEELLAVPGVPTSFAETVRDRLIELGPERTAVLQLAAVMGRDFDWRLVAACGVEGEGAAGAALGAGVAALLLAVDGDRFRFRHALTREAVLATLLPPQRASLAAAALAAIDAAHPGLGEPWADVAADLAAQAGDRARAGALLLASGRAAFDRGALATAVDALRTARFRLAGDPVLSAEAGSLLVEALALAGRVDEALALGDELLAALGDGADTPVSPADVHLTLADAAVAAGRWPLASAHVDEAERLAGLSARSEVVRAEVAINAGDAAGGLRHAGAALAAPGCPTPVRCHALELVGRAHRSQDLGAARTAFEEALSAATDAHLAVWRLRALHELGTVEMFDHAGTARLFEARRAADELGVLSTGALLDMHLAAALMLSFRLDVAGAHAQAAVATSRKLGLDRLHALSLLFLGEIHAMRLERAEMERFIALASAAAPGDVEIEGSSWAGSRGMLALLEGNRSMAIEAIDRGESMLRTVPLSGPATYRGLYPLLLAVDDGGRAAAAIADARRLGMAVSRGNRGLLAYAEAVLAGRLGDGASASALAAQGAADLVHFRGWSDLAMMLAAEAAQADGWGDPDGWRASAGASFAALGLEALAGRCARLGDEREPSRLDAWGVTERERDVLRLVAAGLANKEIAARLSLSPRTVEKHVEALLRKTGARSRTQLVAVAGSAGR